MSPQHPIERLFTLMGNHPIISNVAAGVMTGVCIALLLGLGVLSKLPVESQGAWTVGAAVPMLMLMSGVFEVLGASYATDSERKEHAGSRIFYGAAKAVSSFVLLMSGTVYLFFV